MRTAEIRNVGWLIIMTGDLASQCFATEANTVGICPAKQIVLDLPNNGTKTIPVGAHPYIEKHRVEKDVITLVPGDKIIVEFDLIDSVPRNPRVVEKNIHPERTLELEMTHDPKLTMVTRKSGFAKKLTMKSRFLALGSDSIQETNMDALDNLPSFEGFDATTYCVQFYDFGLE